MNRIILTRDEHHGCNRGYSLLLPIPAACRCRPGSSGDHVRGLKELPDALGVLLARAQQEQQQEQQQQQGIFL